MANNLTNLPNTTHEPIVSAIAALLLVGLCLAVLIRTYWDWHSKNNPRRKGLEISGRKPTLFDVRELLVKGERASAIKVYRQIFKVDQKEAQSAVENLEKNLHQQG